MSNRIVDENSYSAVKKTRPTVILDSRTMIKRVVTKADVTIVMTKMSEINRIYVFSKRQRITLRLLYAMSRPSAVCLSVCLSSVTLVHPT